MDQDKPARKAFKRVIGNAGRWLVVIGAMLLGTYLAARIHAAGMSRVALYEFAEAGRQQSTPSGAAVPAAAPTEVNFSLWSMKRITAYEDSLKRQFAPPLAVLEIPKISLEVPVFDGTDDLPLNRGVGRILGTAHFDQAGNVGIAGHRDGFFRGLKDVVEGDQIELKTTTRTELYRVDKIRIVTPAAVQVLQDRGVATLTLVTCYPFYFIGDAPQRYIVRATEFGRTD